MQGESSPGTGPGTTTPYPFGSAPAPPRPEDLAPLFPHLEIRELLGQGGMGVVYKARQVRLDRLVALKVLPPELGRDPAFAERFAREARALARLTHPRIVAVHDFGQSGGLFYLLMEFVDGVNLRGLLRQGRLKPEEALRIVPQICEALQYAHEEGVVHRDIKPENILLDRRGNVKIADFGLAKLLGVVTPDSALTGSRQVIGTLRYMAPEQMEKPLAVDHRADIYSLGVVFYEMLTGELPLGRFAPPSKKVDVDVRLDQVVFRALEKEPERRYQHISEVKTEVESLAVPPGHSATSSRKGPDRTRSHPAGPAGKGRRAWLLVPIFCAAFVAELLFLCFLALLAPPNPAYSIYALVIPGAVVLALGVGLWAVWPFLPGGRARPIKTFVPEIDVDLPSPTWDGRCFSPQALPPTGSLGGSPGTPGDPASLTPGALLERVVDELRSAAGHLRVRALQFLARVSDEFRSVVDRSTVPAIKALLVAVFVGCLLLFLSSSVSTTPEGGLKIQAGAPSPWFLYEQNPSAFRFQLLFSWSWAIALIGALACCLHGLIRKIETGGRLTKLERFFSKGFALWGWIMIFALAINSIQILIIFFTINPKPPGSRSPGVPGPPIIRSAPAPLDDGMKKTGR
jgi:serine/threonine protein kinase